MAGPAPHDRVQRFLCAGQTSLYCTQTQRKRTSDFLGADDNGTSTASSWSDNYGSVYPGMITQLIFACEADRDAGGLCHHLRPNILPCYAVGAVCIWHSNHRTLGVICGGKRVFTMMTRPLV